MAADDSIRHDAASSAVSVATSEDRASDREGSVVVSSAMWTSMSQGGVEWLLTSGGLVDTATWTLLLASLLSSKMLVLLLLLLLPVSCCRDRGSCLRPARLVAKYSHR